MGWFRWMKAALYRRRIARIDRRLDALQSTWRGLTDRADIRRVGLEFDALAMARAILARRLSRLSGGSLAPTRPPMRRSDSQAQLVGRYISLDRELVEARDSQFDPAEIERLARELASTQREIEAGKPDRAR